MKLHKPMELPLLQLTEPMAPISDSKLPQGDDWCYQLKWDGVRLIADISQEGAVQLRSRKLLNKNSVYPEIHSKLQELAPLLGSCVLDGEVVYWDGVKPNFQKVLQRERIGGRGLRKLETNLSLPRTTNGETIPTGGEEADLLPRLPHFSSGAMLYVLFDLLSENGNDLRQFPYTERYERLKTKVASLSLPVQTANILLIDMHTDGEALWQWVEKHRWEGVVSKRLSSPYRQGKKHRDWLKKKTALLLDVGIIGVKRREGRAASLVMSDAEGSYIGSVSLGLDEAMRQALGNMLQLSSKDAPSWAMPFSTLPAELKGEDIIWLPAPFPCRVTGLELTSAGLLRHPKLVSFGSGTGGQGAEH